MLENVLNLDKKKSPTNSILLINFTFAFFPISFILGNLIINLNLVLFCILGIFYLRSKILTTKYDLVIKIIFLFFFIILFSTCLSFIRSVYFEGFQDVHLSRLIKSITFFRFFLMLIIICLLIKFDILNLKYFFISAAISSFVISLDIIYQYIFGVNIMGLKSLGHHNTGFFGDEWIAGGYIQNFSFFSILFIMLVLKNNNILKFTLTTITICILSLGILLSGNKMPLILFLFGLLILFLLNDKLRKIIPTSLVFVLLLFSYVISSNIDMKKNYKVLYGHLINITNIFDSEKILQKNSKEQKNSEMTEKKNKQSLSFGKIVLLDDRRFHNRLLLTAIDTWRKNKIFGNGIKSFRLDCYDLQSRDLLDESNYTYEYNLAEEYMQNRKNRVCSTHPHNYYFEILTETGVVGIFITLIIALLFIGFVLKNFKVFKVSNIENHILLAATISLILELFPFKSSGSIFTTNDAAYIILIASIVLSYKKKQNLK